MPSFYEGDPIAVLEQKLTQEEYAAAYVLSQEGLTPANRKEFKVAVCVAAAALTGSAIPLYYSYFYSAWLPGIVLAFFLLLGVYFAVVIPRNIREWGKTLFAACRLVQLPTKISVFRDSVRIENGTETITEYWTDFRACMENSRYIVLTGGRQRSRLILKKDGLSPADQERLSTHFKNTFVRRYRRAAR